MNSWYSWDEIPQALLKKPRGLVFLLGGPDTGKTTLLKRIAEAYLSTGLRIGLVDADVGQSTIGPPTTIGMVIAEVDMPDLFWPHALYFAGNNNPVGHLIEVAVGSRRMVDEAIQAGAEAVIFDSGGLIQPPYGRVLKYHKFELLRPRFIVAIERADELTPILSWLSNCWDIEILRTRPPAEVRLVSASERTEYRQGQYRRYFSNATLKSLSLRELCLYPPDFLSGKTDLTGLLVGLQGHDWDTIAIGIIKSVGQNTVEIYASYPSGIRIRGLLAGYIKLSWSGVELGRIRPRQFL
ncbi:MAG: hypothetical protein IBX64_07660 [Actinobacteria bacterium]|nr:hypothetical protein [Actinomycetota bacterium]